MFSSLLFTVIIFLVASNKDCDHYDEGPIHLALNQISGSIEMLDTLEISFDLKINTECIGWCHIFALGGRYPLLYTHSRAFYSEFIQYPEPYSNHVDSINDIYTSMIDAQYHSLYLKYTETERRIRFDDITYINRNDVHNNMIQHKSFDISTVWGSNVQYATNATINHLCINTRFNSISTTTHTTFNTTQNTENHIETSHKVIKTQSKTTINTEYNDDRYVSNFYLDDKIILLMCGLMFCLLIVVCVYLYVCKAIKRNDGHHEEDEKKVKEWLIMIGLEDYYDTFIRNGFSSLEFISKIRNEKDLENIGIDLKGHQIVIMAEIGNLKSLIGDENDELNEGMNNDTNNEGDTVRESNIYTVKDHSDTEQ